MSIRWQGPRCRYCGSAIRSGRVCRPCSDLPPLDPYALLRFPTLAWTSPRAESPEAGAGELRAERPEDRPAS